MGELKLQENFTFTLNFEQSGERKSFVCEDKKILLGSSDLCDIKIKHPGVRHFHCVLVNRSGLLIISKLEASCFFEINGEKVDSAHLKFGDKLSLAGFEIQVGTQQVFHTSHKVELKDISKNRNTTSKKLKGHDNYIYVDGEYVDSKMYENHYKRTSKLFLDREVIKGDSFIPADTHKPFDLHLGKDPISSNKSLDVIFTSFGNILSYDTIAFSEIRNYKKFLSQEIISYLNLDKKTELLNIDGSHLSVNECGGMQRSQDSDDSITEGSDIVILEKGVNQIFFRVGKVVNPIKNISGSVRERKRQAQMSGLILMIFLPMFLLSFLYTVPEIIKEKDVVVIYKQKKKKIIKQKLVQKSDDKSDIDKTAKKEAKKVSENKTETTKTNKVKKVSKAKARKSAPKKRSVKASSKATAKPKVSFASSFSKMIGSSSVKAKNFAKKSKSSGSSLGNLATSKSGSLATVGGGSSVKGLSTSSQFGSGKGFKSKGAAKRGFDSKFTSKRTVVLGALDPAVIDRILREHMPEFRYCYQQELQRNSKTSGKVTTNFTIGSSGRVTKSSIKGNFTSAGTGCMRKVFSNIQFPKPKGGGVVQVKKPFTFNASKTSV